MSRFEFNDRSLSRIQSVGTWVVAIGLLVYEGVARHFVDQSGLALLGGLLGLPVIVSYDRHRRSQAANKGDTDGD